MVDASEPAQEKSAEALSEVIPEAGPEPQIEVPPEPAPETGPEIEPTLCQKDEACNALLDKDGNCPGQCIPQQNKVTCRGTVVNHLCYGSYNNLTNGPKTISGILLEPGSIPNLIQVGETKTFTIKATNTQNQATSLDLQYEMGVGWQLESASFEGLNKIDFKANEVKVLTMKVKAIQADIFLSNNAPGMIIDMNLSRNSFNLYATVVYGPANNIACGSMYFPKSHCPDKPCDLRRRHYYQARCCQSVFYPGAQCCVDTDCQSGACFDGMCVAKRLSTLGNTLPTGHQRVLVVLSDMSDIPSDPSKVCTNRYNDLKVRLKLADFLTYFDKVSQKYTGTPPPKFEWTVLAGINTSDFNPLGKQDLPTLHTALEKYLIDKKCIKGAHEFDKRLLITSKADLEGFTGRANTEGRMVMKSINEFLFVHELMHTYGASDLYLTLGGQLQYWFALMGNNLGTRGLPEMDVARGEITWGDANRNGVIDMFEFALYPDSLVATGLQAQLSAKGTIEVKASVAGVEAGVQKRLFLHQITVELVDYKGSNNVTPGEFTVFPLSQNELDAIRQAGSVKIRVIANIRFTDTNFKRVERTLSSEHVVKLSP